MPKETDYSADIQAANETESEVLQVLEGFFLERIRSFLPQTQIEAVKIKLLSGYTNLADPETQEGASYSHSTRTVILRVPTARDGIYVTEEKSQRLFTLFTFDELLLARQKLDTEFPTLIAVLTGRAIHEAAHSLTFDLWNFSVSHLTEIFIEPTTQEEKTTWDSLQEKIRAAFWIKSETEDLDSLYKGAYATSIELLKEQLKLIKPERRAEFVKTAYLHGLSEIVAQYFGNAVRPRPKEPQREFLTYHYIYQRTDLLFPTPEKFKEIVSILETVSFPLSKKMLDRLHDFCSELQYQRFLEATGLSRYLATM